LNEAKARFDELFDFACTQGPQTVTRKDKEAVVMIAAREYERLTISKRQSLVEFFAQSPLAKADVDLERTPDYGREIDLSS
jgi:prevent-host-death family protein